MDRQFKGDDVYPPFRIFMLDIDVHIYIYVRMHRHDHQLTSKVNLIFDYVEMRALHVRQS